jgi:hypothetical protein
LNQNTRGTDRTKIVEDEDADRAHVVAANGGGSVKGDDESVKQAPGRGAPLSRVIEA